MKKALLLAVAILAAGPALAADWVKFGETDEDEFYFDRQTIRVVDRNIKHVWMLMSRDAPDKIGNRSSKVLVENDCIRWRRRIVQITPYVGRMGSGDNRGSFAPESPASDWKYPPPDSIGDSLLKEVCPAR